MLSHAPRVSPSVGVLEFWQEAVAWEELPVCFWSAVGLLSPHHCQLCLLGLGEEVGVGEAMTWSHGGSGDGGDGDCGDDGDLASPTMAVYESRRRLRRMRTGEEVGEV